MLEQRHKFQRKIGPHDVICLGTPLDTLQKPTSLILSHANCFTPTKFKKLFCPPKGPQDSTLIKANQNSAPTPTVPLQTPTCPNFFTQYYKIKY